MARMKLDSNYFRAGELCFWIENSEVAHFAQKFNHLGASMTINNQVAHFAQKFNHLGASMTINNQSSTPLIWGVQMVQIFGYADRVAATRPCLLG